MSKKLYAAFQANVRARMDALGVTQSQLARKLQVSPAFVSQLLNGKSRPGLDTLENFGKALQCQAADLIRVSDRAA